LETDDLLPSWKEPPVLLVAFIEVDVAQLQHFLDFGFFEKLGWRGSSL
jgi:hypothetical protein